MKPGCGLIAAVLVGTLAFLLGTYVFAGEGTVEATVEVKTMNLTDRTSPPPFEPKRIDVDLLDGPIEGFSVPDTLAEPILGTLEIGGSKKNLVIGKSAVDARGHDLVWIDADGDGTLSDAEKHTLTIQERPMRGGGTMISGFNPNIVLDFSDTEWPIVFICSKAGDTPLRSQVIMLWYLEARFTAAEIEYVASFMDADSDGSFGGEADRWVLEQAGPRSRPTSAFGMSALGEGRYMDDHNFQVAVDGTAVKVSFAAAEGPDPADLEAQRERAEHLWFELFDGEREQFLAARGLDTDRPLAEEPIAWRYVTFAEAKEMAKAEGKALFVDIMAFWCIWCYRMDYYTYPDKEVADLMNGKFIPVKIIQEQDPVGDYDKVRGELGASGIPAMGIWSPDGKLLTKIGGWSKPEDFLGQLNEGLAKIEKGDEKDE